MPDFNKGDFTQQGVAGHVNANLRLNEKRLVNIDLTSNEEAEGCTITGTVTDLLNDKVYGIGSGVSGNIEITENGENINVAPFATATVNVSGGGGGIYTTAITFENSTSYDQEVLVQHLDDTEPSNVIKGTPVTIPIQESKTINVPIRQSAMGDDTYSYGTSFRIAGINISASDAVNCTYIYDSFMDVHIITVTDISEPSSITLLMSTLS